MSEPLQGPGLLLPELACPKARHPCRSSQPQPCLCPLATGSCSPCAVTLRSPKAPRSAGGKEPVCQSRRLKKLVQSLGWEDPLEEGQPTPVFLPGESPWTEPPGVHGVARSWTGLKRLSTQSPSPASGLPTLSPRLLGGGCLYGWLPDLSFREDDSGLAQPSLGSEQFMVYKVSSLVSPDGAQHQGLL